MNQQIRTVFLALLLPAVVLACNEMIVGKTASNTGTPLLAYNNDWDGFKHPYVEAIDKNAQRAVLDDLLGTATVTSLGSKLGHYGGLMIRTRAQSAGFEMHPENGFNVAGFAVDFGTYLGMTDESLAVDPSVADGVGYDMWESFPASFSTVSNALTVLDLLAQQHGFNDILVDTSVDMIDLNEAWQIYIVGGRNWVACKIANNAILDTPNLVRFTRVTVALDGSGSCRASSGFKNWAIAAGLTVTTSSKQYVVSGLDSITVHDMCCDKRITKSYQAVTGRSNPTFADDGSARVSTGSVSVETLMGMQRSGLPVPTVHGIPTVSSHGIPYELGCPISRVYTDYGVIVVPGQMIWLAMGTPDVSVYVPLLLATTVPSRLDANTEITPLFRRLQLLVDRATPYTDDLGCGGPVDTCATGVSYTQDYGFTVANGFDIPHDLGTFGDACASEDVAIAERKRQLCLGVAACNAAGEEAPTECCTALDVDCSDFHLEDGAFAAAFAKDVSDIALYETQQVIFEIYEDAASAWSSCRKTGNSFKCHAAYDASVVAVEAAIDSAEIMVGLLEARAGVAPSEWEVWSVEDD